jgi:putative copper export protein
VYSTRQFDGRIARVQGSCSLLQQVTLPLIAAAARSLLLTGIILLGGSVTLYWLLLQHTLATRGAARAARAAVVLILIGLAFSLLAQYLEFRDPRAPAMSEAALLMRTSWGRVWRTQLGLGIAGALICAFVSRTRAAWIPLTACAVALAASPSFASHAMATEHWKALAVSADVMHMMAGSAWIGGLLLLAWMIARGDSNQPSSGATVLMMVRRFSPLALTSATVLVGTGLIGVFLRLTAVQELWTSGYGRLLSAKILLFCCVAGGGLYNWKRATPRLEQTGDAQSMRTSLRVEIAFALALLLVTAVLVATPPPGE